MEFERMFAWKLQNVDFPFFFLIYYQLERASHLNNNQVPEDKNDESFHDYLDSMVKFARMCGVSEARARDEMLDMLEFQQSLMNKVSLCVDLGILYINSKWSLIFENFRIRFNVSDER